eukprot:scaffold28620_cov73-Phaeocystis_antarctica.AAC.1
MEKDKDADDPAAEARSPMRSLIRAKGFIWLSNSHSQIFYWALAGKHFELKQYAAWWSSLPRDEWPADQKQVAEILKDFADDEMGDRRQELVFIGVNMDREAITLLLDGCLLSDSEMADQALSDAVEPSPLGDGPACSRQGPADWLRSVRHARGGRSSAESEPGTMVSARDAIGGAPPSASALAGYGARVGGVTGAWTL